jgi:hypothetical protein
MTKIKTGPVSDTKVIILCLFLSIIIFIIDSSIPLGVAGGVPYILVVLISLWSEKKSLPILAAILGSILTVAGFYSSPPGGELWKVIFNRALALFAIWTTAVLSMQRNVIMEERQSALNDREKAWADLKVLKGLLPICSSCKKIRDGKGYWNQIESYIREHSEAEFSHGLCEECTEKLYGDEDWYKRMKRSSKE